MSQGHCKGPNTQLEVQQPHYHKVLDHMTKKCGHISKHELTWQCGQASRPKALQTSPSESAITKLLAFGKIHCITVFDFGHLH